VQREKERLKVGVDARLLCLPLTGIGRYTAELCNHLCCRGLQVICYLPGPLSAAYSLDQRIQVRAGCGGGELAKMLWSQTTLPKWATRDAVDVLWGTSHRLPFHLRNTVSRVVTIHDMVWQKYPQTMRKSTLWAERIFMPPAVYSADRIIADSQSTATDLRIAFPRCVEKIQVVYPGAGVGHEEDAAGFVHLAELGIGRPFFLFVGTLEPRKNLERLITAYALVPHELRKETQMVIVGGQGWGGLELSRWIDLKGLADDVVTTGYVTDAQLSELYTQARFLAMPSLYEGFGFPVLEAMARGTPALISNISSLPEVGGDAAVMVNPLDATSIAGGLIDLLSGSRRDELAPRSRVQAKKFSWDKAAVEVEAVFREALQERVYSRRR
jgi:glycosyltransferase involved in cell wall biosynthesis